MRSRFILTIIIIIFASAVCSGQGIVTPRIKSDAEQKSGDAAKNRPQQKTGSESKEKLPAALPVSAIKIKVSIDGQVATVTVEHLFRNDTDDTLEGTYYFPVPEAASLVEFAVFDGDERRVGRVKEKEEALAQFQAAVSQGEDPAILEMTRRGWFQSRIYPIQPHSDKRIELIYSQLLTEKNNLIVFDYPLGKGYKKLKVPVGKVEIEVDLRSAVAIKNVFSPTHPLDLNYDGDQHVTGKIATVGGKDAENFQLTYSLSNDDIGMSLITYRKEGEDGYFLLMLSPKVEFDEKRISAKDVLFVLDVSGSMVGDRLVQAKEALRFGLAKTLNDEDRFNIIVFSSGIQPMSQGMVAATRDNVRSAIDFVDKLKAEGGTNINDALTAAMKMFEPGSRPRNLVFITDGEPTIGVTNPAQIVANVRAANTARARLFTFGVGETVNHVLLEKLALENRGAQAAINDQSQLARVVTSFFSKVSRPVLSDLNIDFGPLQTDRLHPSTLPDLYTKSQMKVFGRYRNAQDLRDLTITLTGQMNEQLQRFDFHNLDFPLVTTDKNYLPKLWATERVEALLAEIRVSGEQPDLKQEVIDLAQEFNLVTPYTSMYVPTSAELAREKTNPPPAEEAEDKIASIGSRKRKQRSPGSPSATPGGSIGTGSGGGMGSGEGRGVGAGTASGVGPTTTSGLTQLPTQGRGIIALAQLAPGTVSDSQGAAIAGATVTLKDQSTGATRTVTTDAAGNYSISELPPGSYTMVVAAPGFKKTEVQDVIIQPGKITEPAVELSAGNVSETVVVTAGASVLHPSVGNISSNFDRSDIRELPTLAAVESFARLGPGIAAFRLDDEIGRFPGLDRDAEFKLAINGGRPRSYIFTLDGQSNNDIDGRPVIAINNFDAAESLHVVTTPGTGEQNTSASSINLVTRSGSNDFHGTVFDYHLNRRLGALSVLERRSGFDRAPKFMQSLFGGTLGGPLRRDRIFFFASFQAERGNANRFIDSTSSFLTPTARGLQQLARAFSSSTTVSDLTRRGPLTRSAANPTVQRTFIVPVLGTPVEFGQITRIIPSTTEGYEAGGRLNFHLTRRDSLDARYWYDGRSSTNSIEHISADYIGNSDARSQLGGIRWNRSISPRSVNELGFGFNRSRQSLTSSSDFTRGDSSDQGPGVSTGFRSLAYGNSALLPASHTSTLFDVSDALIHNTGRHHIRLGAQVQRRLTHFDSTAAQSGHYTYASFEDFVLDRPAALTIGIGDPRASFTETRQHYYIDDAWRLRSNLTVSLGLSYENASQPINGLADRLRDRESSAGTALFDQSLPIDARVIAKADRDNNNLAPRIAFAYMPRFRIFDKNLFGYDKTVVRGGVAVSYDQTAYRPLADVAASAPNILFAVLTPSAEVELPPFPAVPDAGTLNGLLGGDPGRYARAGVASDFRSPYSVTWHLASSRNFNDKAELELSYVGSRAADLIRLVDGNPFAAGLRSAAAGPFRIYESSGRSTYNSFQARTEIRLGNHLTGGVAYTLSKLIDDVPDNNAQIAGGIGNPASLIAPGLQSFAQNPLDVSRGERALSSLDRRHTLTGHFLWKLPLRSNQAGLVGRLLGGWQASGIIGFASGSPFTPLQRSASSAGAAALFASALSDRLGSTRPFTANPSAPSHVVAFSNAANALLHLFMNADGSPFISSTGFIIADRAGFREGVLSEARFVYNDFLVEQAARRMGLPADAFGQTFAAGRPFGDVGRNTLFGPRFVNTDFALLKATKLSEKVSLQFRAEFFNLFNHPSRTKPNAVLENAGGFGFADLGETDAPPRRLRLALKLIF